MASFRTNSQPLLSPLSAPEKEASPSGTVPSGNDSGKAEEGLLVEEHPLNVKHELVELLKLAWPVIVTSALEFVPGFATVVMSGNLDSPYTQEYVSAATLSTTLTNLTSVAIVVGLSSAIDTLCSQAYGAQRLHMIGIYFQASLIIVGVVCIPVFFFNFYAEQILLGLGQEPDIASFAGRFSRLNLIGLPPLFLYELERRILQTQNIVYPSVFVILIGNIVTILSGYGMAFQSSMEFDGVPLSRSIANWVMAIALSLYIAFGPKSTRQWWGGWDLKAASKHVPLYLRIGFPGMIMVLCEFFAFELMTIFAGLLPNASLQLSAHSVVVNINFLIYMAFLGLSVASSIRVGNALGAGRPKQAKMVSIISFFVSLAASIIVAIILMTLRFEISKLVIDDMSAVGAAGALFIAWGPFQTVDGVNAICQGVFRGAGKQMPAAITNGIAYYAFGMPLAALLAFLTDLDVKGLWIGFGVGDFLSMAGLIVLWLRWDWDKLSEDASKRTEDQT